jgi:lipopolysaccharide export system permease protein
MSYFKPFLSSLVVSLVILVLQFLSRYKSDLFGKGLGFGTIIEIFFYAGISLMVLAMPVAVLLSSLFTMGNFGENYELAAMRSAGMSVPRILRPMFLLTLLISAVSFGMSSYVVPWANLKLYHILYDVQQLKPVFRLEPGHFNAGVDDYVIRITDKDVSRDMLFGVRIYDHTHAAGDTAAVRIYHRGTSREMVRITDSTSRNNRFVYAESGTMKIDPYGRYLQMMLYNGTSYEGSTEVDRFRNKSQRFARIAFDSLFYSFDMSGYASEQSDEKDFSTHQYMLNLSELGHAVDSIREVKAQLTQNLEFMLSKQVKIDEGFLKIDTTLDGIPPENFVLQFPKAQRKSIIKTAITRIMGATSTLRKSGPALEEEERQIRERAIEFHGKMSLPMACLIFLFIGAPLGAIIRKGGVGVPIVVSVVLFLAFYVLMIEGKKLATEGVISPFTGAWLPVIVMFPIAMLLTLESTAAVRIFSADNVWHFGRAALRIIILTNPLYWIYRIPPVERFLKWVLRPVGKLFRRKETARTFRVRR